MASHVRVKANRYNHIVALFVCLGSYAYGFNSGVIGAVIGLPSWYRYFGMVSGSAYAASIIDASNGLYYAGGFFGCLTVNWLSDTLGQTSCNSANCLSDYCCHRHPDWLGPYCHVHRWPSAGWHWCRYDQFYRSHVHFRDCSR